MDSFINLVLRIVAEDYFDKNLQCTHFTGKYIRVQLLYFLAKNEKNVCDMHFTLIFYFSSGFCSSLQIKKILPQIPL